MILGTGVDITSIERVRRGVARLGGRFAAGILSPRELEAMPLGERAHAFLAGRWAAKEAFVKALGTGFANGVAARTITIANDAQGAPHLEPGDPATPILERMGVTRIHVSISHDRENAVAMVILEGPDR